MRRSSIVVLLVVGALLVPAAVFASHQFNDVPDSHMFHTGIKLDEGQQHHGRV
jgi:hypothetical protein